MRVDLSSGAAVASGDVAAYFAQFAAAVEYGVVVVPSDQYRVWLLSLTLLSGCCSRRDLRPGVAL